MKTSSIFVPVLFIVLLFIIVLPRLIGTQTASAQILPPTSITPAAMAEPRVSFRPVAASQTADEALPVLNTESMLAEAPAALPGLNEFAAPYLNGRADEVVAVSVQDRFTLPVIQQPSDQAAFVSTDQDVLTQFGLPRQYGTTGLLAHNFLSGKLFTGIIEGDIVTIVRGDGTTDYFEVNRIESYQALSPNSPYSQFIDLNDPAGQQLSSANLFNRIYTHPDQVVFQTCIAANGDSSWGRLFITASRISLSSGIPTPEAFINNN